VTKALAKPSDKLSEAIWQKVLFIRDKISHSWDMKLFHEVETIWSKIEITGANGRDA